MKNRIIKIFAVALAIMVLLSCFTACGKVKSLVLSHTDLVINEGNATAITYDVLPEKATVKNITWSSSNNEIATVNNVGVITGVSAGDCIITVTTGKVSATLNVTVKKPVEQVIFDKSDVAIKEEETFTLSCTIVPNDASEKDITWTSSNNAIATVDVNGKITGVKKGECTITATADGKIATAKITVKEKGPDFKKLYEGIESSVKYGWEVGSDGSYLMADTNVYDLDDFSNSSIWKSIKDMNKKLGLPSSLDNDMGQTTWSMGRQNQTFESVGITVTWTYHPDKGMEVTYKLINN